jgi:phage terminase large subunit-like protein
LHPEREPPVISSRSAARSANTISPAKYQHAPSPLSGGLIKAAWFRHYAPAELPQRFERVVQSWDTASKATELSDFSVCTT